MRILMVTDFYWPFVGGVEQAVRRLSHALARRGSDVAVATLGDGRLEEFEQDGPVRVHRIHSLAQRFPGLFAHPKRPWAPPFPDLALTGALKRVAAQEQPDIVHGHDWMARSFLPSRARSRARFIMSLHYYTLSCAKKNLLYKEEPCQGPGLTRCLRCAAGHYGLVKGLPVTLGNWIMSAAEKAAVDMFLPVSRATAVGNGLEKGDRFEVVPNFMPEGPAAALDLSPYLSQLPAEPFLLFVGDLRRAKGLEVLLSAYGSLQNAPPLVLIGKVWAETPRVFPPHVLVLKDWPNEAVLTAWERSLVAVVPSLWPEPFGLVVIEAMAAGRPVIASRIGGIPDLVRDGISGLLLPPGDVPALRQALERILSDPALREQMGQAARREAAAFQAAVVVPRIEQIYRKVLNLPSEMHEPATPGEHHYQQL